jgi:hypothetical protein
MTLDDWIEATEANYLSDFIREGGASVKFAIAMPKESTEKLGNRIRERAVELGYLVSAVDSAKTRISSIDHVFGAIASQIDLTSIVDGLLGTLASANHWTIPDYFDDGAVANQIAEHNQLGVEIVSMDFKRLLQTQVMKNTFLARDFKIAMTQLALARLSGGDQYVVASETIRGWLGGEVKTLAQLKPYMIHAKVSKANARNIFGSFLTGLSLSGFPGLVVTLDISQLMDPEKNPERINYTKSALLDAYEVLREFIDATDDLEHLLLVVTAPQSFLDLDTNGRGIGRYQALKARVYDEVRDRNYANPMSALIRVGSENSGSSM